MQLFQTNIFFNLLSVILGTHPWPLRQILVKDGKSKSWFVYVNKVLNQYELPSTIDLLNVTYTTAQWKDLFEQAINKDWSEEVLTEAVSKAL